MQQWRVVERSDRAFEMVHERTYSTDRGHAKQVHALAYLQDGTRIASSAGDSSVRIWNISTGTVEQVITGMFGSEVYSLLYLTDGRLVTGDVGSGKGTVRAFEVSPPTYKQVFELAGHSNSVRGLALTPSGKLLTGSSDYNLRTWRIPDKGENGAGVKSEAIWAGHSDFVYCVDVLGDGRPVSACLDKKVHIWNLVTNKPEITLPGEGPRHRVVVLPDSRILVGGAGGASNLSIYA